ncbi:MAG: helix-turn-helix transcriptional regulator [Gemmatimonadaceae bacterium]|nr:helix-turn-helix transcriptional regulator [Gemmatimonadaceae bacterium]
MALPQHSHSVATITVILSGSYQESVSGGFQHLPSMSVVVKPPDVPHSNIIGTAGAQCLLIEVPDSALLRMRDVTTLFNEPRLIPLSISAPLVIRSVHYLSALTRCDLSIESLVLELTSIIAIECGSMEVGRSSPHLHRVIQVLNDLPSDQITLPALGRVAGLHPMSLTRAFRRTYGMSIGGYSTSLRVARAARRLSDEGETSISRIAIDTGYYDHSHITHDFRIRAGVTPTEWRSMASICKTG